MAIPALPGGYAFRRSLYNGGNNTLHVIAGSKADGSFGGKALCGGPRWATWSAIVDPRQAVAHWVCKRCRAALERMATAAAIAEHAERHPIDEVVRAAQAAGSHFFDPDTVRFFGTRYGGSCWAPAAGPWMRFFATSEQPPHGPRVHVVRVARYRDSQRMEGFTTDTLAGLNAGPGPASKEDAEAICRALASGHATAPNAKGSTLAAWDAAKANLRQVVG